MLPPGPSLSTSFTDQATELQKGEVSWPVRSKIRTGSKHLLGPLTLCLESRDWVESSSSVRRTEQSHCGAVAGCPGCPQNSVPCLHLSTAGVMEGGEPIFWVSSPPSIHAVSTQGGPGACVLQLRVLSVSTGGGQRSDMGRGQWGSFPWFLGGKWGSSGCLVS